MLCEGYGAIKTNRANSDFTCDLLIRFEASSGIQEHIFICSHDENLLPNHREKVQHLGYIYVHMYMPSLHTQNGKL